jgi:hypothetical protein
MVGSVIVGELAVEVPEKDRWLVERVPDRLGVDLAEEPVVALEREPGFRAEHRLVTPEQDAQPVTTTGRDRDDRDDPILVLMEDVPPAWARGRFREIHCPAS